jgi:DNA-binding transcriptional ArsR family regulator
MRQYSSSNINNGMTKGKTFEGDPATHRAPVPDAHDEELDDLTDELLENIASRLKAMGNASRLKILHALEPGERSVTEILEVVGGTQANISKHLQVLRSADLVESRRDGMNTMYRIRSSYIFGVCETVCDSILHQANYEAKKLGRARDALRSRLRETKK